MKMKQAKKNGFKVFPDGKWRKKNLVKKTGNYVWQLWHLKTCQKCGDEFLPASREVATCGHSCAVLGEKRALGCRYERPKDYRIIHDGYAWVYEKESPMANKIGRVLEHRHIISKELGRPLERREHVHHINGNKLDNRRENLVLLMVSEHMSVHNHDKIMKRNENNGRFEKLIGYKGNHEH